MEKVWSEDMGEISGFGGGYEAVCRAMVLAGIKWIDEHPEANLQYRGFKNVFGVINENSADAKALDAAMMDAPVLLDGKLLQVNVREDCTGAMHHAAVQHCLAYKQLGWDRYCKELRERERQEQKAAESAGPLGR